MRDFKEISEIAKLSETLFEADILKFYDKIKQLNDLEKNVLFDVCLKSSLTNEELISNYLKKTKQKNIKDKIFLLFYLFDFEDNKLNISAIKRNFDFIQNKEEFICLYKKMDGKEKDEFISFLITRNKTVKIDWLIEKKEKPNNINIILEKTLKHNQTYNNNYIQGFYFDINNLKELIKDYYNEVFEFTEKNKIKIEMDEIKTLYFVYQIFEKKELLALNIIDEKNNEKTKERF